MALRGAARGGGGGVRAGPQGLGPSARHDRADRLRAQRDHPRARPDGRRDILQSQGAWALDERGGVACAPSSSSSSYGSYRRIWRLLGGCVQARADGLGMVCREFFELRTQNAQPVEPVLSLSLDRSIDRSIDRSNDRSIVLVATTDAGWWRRRASSLSSSLRGWRRSSTRTRTARAST